MPKARRYFEEGHCYPLTHRCHDRLGRQRTITDVLGLRSFAYDDFLQQTSEVFQVSGFPFQISREYDSLGRPSGLSLGTYSVSYGYDAFGRFGSLNWQSEFGNRQFSYSYLPSSDLLSGYVLTSGGSAAALTVNRTYEPNRNLISSIQNRFNDSIISSFNYENDAIGRRTKRVDSTSTTNAFGYNIRSELIEAVMGTNSMGYQYDPIGNRERTRINANTNFYIANELNQYLSISNRQSEIENRPFYDPDGNMLTHNGWTFSWDAEKRLIMASNGTTVVENTYDYMSRRVGKKVFTDNWSLVTAHSFLYDGWNLISEVSSQNSEVSTNYYVWGLDLSGTVQGAGGIGGLLCSYKGGANPPGEPLFYTYDANGNVSDLVDTNGTSVAHYEYDPYGNETLRTGPEATSNPFRFSTKYADDETSLYYYGFRYYSPELGRWISRDPLEEFGGFNLSSLTGNNSINGVDILGLEGLEGSGPLYWL